MKRIFKIAGLALLAAGCSRSEAKFGDEAAADAGLGGITVEVVDAASSTRADAVSRIQLGDIIPGWKAPDWKTALAVLLTNEEGGAADESGEPFKICSSVKEFNALSDKHYTFRPGSYSVKLVSKQYPYVDLSSGEEIAFAGSGLHPEAAVKAEEGTGKPYFEGSASGIEVKKRKTAEASVSVRVANTAVCFEFTDAFRSYFVEAQMTLLTDSGMKVDFGYGHNRSYQKEYYWINPRGFSLSGSVRRQDPSPGILESQQTVLDDMVVADGEVKPQYLYTYRFDIAAAGSTEDNASEWHGVRITVDGSPIETIDITDDEGNPDFELNPDVDPKE